MGHPFGRLESQGPQLLGLFLGRMPPICLKLISWTWRGQFWGFLPRELKELDQLRYPPTSVMNQSFGSAFRHLPLRFPRRLRFCTRPVTRAVFVLSASSSVCETVRCISSHRPKALGNAGTQHGSSGAPHLRCFTRRRRKRKACSSDRSDRPGAPQGRSYLVCLGRGLRRGLRQVPRTR